MSEDEQTNPEHIDGQLPTLQDIFPDEIFKKLKKKLQGSIK